MQFFHNVHTGRFLSRPNRFIVKCTVKGKRVRAYLPNPGRLWELLFPGTILHLAKRDSGRSGSTDYTVVAVERDGTPIMLHTHVNNLVARQLIEENKIPGLEHSSVIRTEIPIGGSRFDFLLNRAGQEIVLEVKSCTLVGRCIAMFPDAITARGTKHLRELADLADRGRKVAVLFLVHWHDARYFMPEHHTDLVFSRMLLSVKDKVMIRAVSVAWTASLTPGATHELAIPWPLVAKEAQDRGSYILIMKLARNRRLTIDGLGSVKFEKGYYLHIGSADTNLTGTMERLRRLHKERSRHVDYLRAEADVHAILAIRTGDSIECEIAEKLRSVADWDVPAIVAPECSCRSHLFGMHTDPLHHPAFIRVIQYFRIDRLEGVLK